MAGVPVRALRVTYVGELGWELYCPAEYGAGLWARSGRPASRTGSWPADTARSTRCAWRRAIASGARTSRPTTRPTRPGSALRCTASKEFLGRDALDERPARRLRLHRARGHALRCARERAGARGRRDRGPRDHRWLRLHDRALGGLRVPAGGARRARHGGRARHLRRVDRRRGARASRCSTRAAGGYAARREPRPDRPPYDEAYDERGEPRPHYAELLEAIADPGALRDEALRRLEARGVTFGGGEVARFDPMPRILDRARVVGAAGGDRPAAARAGGVRARRVRRRQGVRGGRLHARGGGGVAALRAGDARRLAAAVGRLRRARRDPDARRPLPCDRGPAADAVRDRLRGGLAGHPARAPPRRAAAGRRVARRSASLRSRCATRRRRVWTSRAP